MTAEQFAYWMQGFAELSGDAPPTPQQWKSIREHLSTVFHKVTPPMTPAKPLDQWLRNPGITVPQDGRLIATC